MSKKPEEKVAVDYSFPYMRDVNSTTSKWETLQLFLYNSEKGTVLGRTRKSWAQIIFFYIIFYSALSALFTICMKGMLSTIDNYEPRRQLDDSCIGTNPGLGFRPLSERTEEGSLIWYDSKNQTQIKRWVNLLDNFLEPYLTPEKLKGGGRNHEHCEFDKPLGHGKVCSVDVQSWGACAPSANYSYAQSSPCFFLKLNKIYGWVPQFYDDPNDLHPDMPDILKTYISNLPPASRKQVWITCDGESPVDKELVGPQGIKYIPTHGFPSYYYPYTNTEGYLSPLVAIQLVRPPLNRIINIECRAWAKNIKYVGGRDRQGSVHFEVMID